MKASWKDLALFLALAESGGLAVAARVTGVSAPTLSRRMTQLENDLGKRLFLRGSQGYSLSADGKALLPLVREMQRGAGRVAQWAADRDTALPVRISAGSWMTLWLADNLHRVWSPQAPWYPEFIAAEAMMDIARREVDIGLRNIRPEQPWLAVQPLGEVHFAAYASAPEVTGWIASGPPSAPTASARWIRDNHGDQIVARINDSRSAARMARRGLGRAVLPSFAADLEPGLVPVSQRISDLSHRLWLVSHQDGRHDPPVRAALTALAKLLTAPPFTDETR